LLADIVGQLVVQGLGMGIGEGLTLKRLGVFGDSAAILRIFNKN
jgi:hypothetical protein